MNRQQAQNRRVRNNWFKYCIARPTPPKPNSKRSKKKSLEKALNSVVNEVNKNE